MPTDPRPVNPAARRTSTLPSLPGQRSALWTLFASACLGLVLGACASAPTASATAPTAGTSAPTAGATAPSTDESAAPLADGPLDATKARIRCAICAIEPDFVVPRLRADSFDAWVSYLTPCADELSWAAVDWLPTYAEGVAAAQAQRRPLLLWAMNGHPLGCT